MTFRVFAIANIHASNVIHRYGLDIIATMARSLERKRKRGGPKYEGLSIKQCVTNIYTGLIGHISKIGRMVKYRSLEVARFFFLASRTNLITGRRTVIWTCESEHMTSDVPFSKTSPGVCEQILPFPFEHFVFCGVGQCRVILDN